MADPYAIVPSAPAFDDENQSFINNFTEKADNAYDDEHTVGDVQLIKYASAPDPNIASSAAVIDSDHDPINEGDEGFGHSTFGQRMDYSSARYQDPFFLILWLCHLLVLVAALVYQWTDTQIV